MAEYKCKFNTYNELLSKEQEIIDNVKLLIDNPIIGIINHKFINNSWELIIEIKHG